MNYKRIGRALVCLLLVCCLIVNVSPVRAKAVTVSTVALSVALPVGIYACMQALGVRPGSDSTAFYQVVNSCADALSQEWAVDGLTTMLALATDGVTRTFANQNFLQAILDWLFSNLVITFTTPSFALSHSITYGSTSKTYYSKGDFIIVAARCYYNDTYWDWLGAASESRCRISPYASVNSNVDSYTALQDSGIYVAGLANGGNLFGNSVSLSSNVTFVEINCSSFDDATATVFSYPWLSSGEIATTQDLTLESVGHDIETDYETYVGTGIVHDDGIPYVPVTIPSLSTDTFVDQTQAQAQAGTTSEAIVEELLGTQTDTDVGTGTITGTGTIADVIAHIKALPQTIADVFADVIAGVKAIPQTIAKALTDAFVISDTFIATKVEALTAKYTYLEPMLTLGDHLKVYFVGLGTEPPIIYIDLGAATGSYYFGGRTVFVDLTWYEQYKPTMDAIIAGFLWLWVAWRLFQSVPGIIQGLSGIWGTPESVPDATFHNPKYQVGKNWLNSGSFYHRKGDRGE